MTTPKTSLRATALAEDWGDHEWAKEQAYALSLRAERPLKYGITGENHYRNQARRLARSIERERTKRLKANPEKCGVWPLVMSVLISLIGTMLSSLFKWAWNRWNKASQCDTDEWEMEILETENL